MVAGIEVAERWSSGRLAELIAGTKASWWLAVGVPRLVDRGVLVKVGRGWFGRRGEIESAILGTKAA